MTDQPRELRNLPDEILLDIGKYLSQNDLCAFALTEKNFLGVAKEILYSGGIKIHGSHGDMPKLAKLIRSLLQDRQLAKNITGLEIDAPNKEAKSGVLGTLFNCSSGRTSDKQLTKLIMGTARLVRTVNVPLSNHFVDQIMRGDFSAWVCALMYLLPNLQDFTVNRPVRTGAFYSDMALFESLLYRNTNFAVDFDLAKIPGYKHVKTLTVNSVIDEENSHFVDWKLIAKPDRLLLGWGLPFRPFGLNITHMHLVCPTVTLVDSHQTMFVDFRIYFKKLESLRITFRDWKNVSSTDPAGNQVLRKDPYPMEDVRQITFRVLITKLLRLVDQLKELVIDADTIAQHDQVFNLAEPIPSLFEFKQLKRAKLLRVALPWQGNNEWAQRAFMPNEECHLEIIEMS